MITLWLAPLKDETGRVTHLIASGVDITERTRAEAALREREQQLSLFGYPAEDFTSGKRTSVSIIEPADWDRVWQETQAAIEARRPYVLEYRVRTATGEEKWAWERGAGVFDGDTLVALEGFITDITDRKRAEASLVESQQRLALATDSAHIGIWDWDVVANKLDWDATMYELYGIRP